MKLVSQRIFANPVRGDGHDADGNPGDCLRACVATVTGYSYERVPHFAQYVSWWEQMRRWARGLPHPADFWCVVEPNDLRELIVCPGSGMFIASGPSPRGNFRHVVVVDIDLQLVHDPHPLGDGLLSVEDVFIYVDAYYPPPLQTLIGRV